MRLGDILASPPRFGPPHPPRIRITIAASSPAFRERGTRAEMAAILRRTAEMFEEYGPPRPGSTAPIRDSDGVRVGSLTVD